MPFIVRKIGSECRLITLAYDSMSTESCPADSGMIRSRLKNFISFDFNNTLWGGNIGPNTNIKPVHSRHSLAEH